MKNLKNCLQSYFKRYRTVLFFSLLVGIFFKDFLFRQLVPIPLDALVGAYYPWLDYKWGYEVGVPLKNIALTDVFSQLYPWRLISMESFKLGQWPLWNPYSFSGTPLLANWQSAPFYPLNILVYVLGDVWGWSLLIIMQPILSLYFMYLYLRLIRLERINSLIGAVVFSFSGFMVTYMQYGTFGQIVLWLPLQLYLIEKYLDRKKATSLALFSLTFFPVLTGGFFQPAIYTLAISVTYGFIRLWKTTKRKLKYISTFLFFIGAGVATASLQLLPTFELFQHSIRLLDVNISEYQYGLLPLRNIITLFAPDFFGNPATNNFWGFLQYQEVTGYFSIIAFILVISAVFQFRKSFYHWYFSLIFIGSLLLSFKNPLSQLIYQMDLPGISTGYASRLLILTSFSASILAAFGSRKIKSKTTLRVGLFINLLLLTMLVIILCYYKFPITDVFQSAYSFFGLKLHSHFRISYRNLILPIGLLGIFSTAMCLVKSQRKLVIITLILISFDLLRFGHKFTPFSSPSMANLSTPVVEYVQNNAGNFRMEREWGPVMPPNTWIYPRLYSPSGYDPMAVLSYAKWYRAYQGVSDFSQSNHTRYLELQSYDSPYMDFVGVKYLLALKRDEDGKINSEGQYINKIIPEDKFTKVFEDGATVVLENETALPRAVLYDKFYVERDNLKALQKLTEDFDFRKEVVIDQPPSFPKHMLSSTDSAVITSYTPNKVQISTITQQPTILVLTDTHYPGWQVYVDGKPKEIYLANGAFRAVELSGGQHEVRFIYDPESFKIGLRLSGATLLFLFSILIYHQKEEIGKLAFNFSNHYFKNRDNKTLK